MDLAQSARANRRKDFVRAKPRAYRQARLVRTAEQVSRDLDSRALQRPLQAILPQQRLHLAAQPLIPSTRFDQEGSALVRLEISRRVVQGFDLAKALRGHLSHHIIPARP